MERFKKLFGVIDEAMKVTKYKETQSTNFDDRRANKVPYKHTHTMGKTAI